MFRHEKQLLEIVKVEKPNINYANLLHEQIGGANGELKAALQYIGQSFRINDPQIKDMFMDIAAEELSHLEMVSTAVNLLNGFELTSGQSAIGQVETQVLTGLAPFLGNASGVPFSSAYVNVTGDLAADLLSDIAAEQRAKVVYEYLYRQIEDKHVRQMIDFLLNREEAHNTLFRQAFNKIQESGSNKDWGVDSDARKFFNLSTPGGQAFPLDNPQHPSFNQPNPH